MHAFTEQVCRQLEGRESMLRPSSIAIHHETLKGILRDILDIPPNKEVKEPLQFLGMRVVKDAQALIGGFKLLP